jgi:ABC-2 type transport system permease protein
MNDVDSLLEVNTSGWRAGFANMFRMENERWWRTRRWWIQSLIWLVAINGLVMMDDFWSAGIRELILSEGIQQFFLLVLVFPAIGIAITMQRDIIREKQLGTAEWILSKPISRSAFVLAKLLANTIAALLIMIVLQGSVAYLQISAAAGGSFPLLPFMGKLGMAALHLLFYLTLTLMLGTLFNASGPVIGISLTVLIGQQLFAQFFPHWLTEVTPGILISAATSGLESPGITSLVAIAAWAVLFGVVAIWRFNLEEF